MKSFRPDLLVRNDNDGLDPGVLVTAPSWVEVKYRDSMDAGISLSGRIEEFDDASWNSCSRRWTRPPRWSRRITGSRARLPGSVAGALLEVAL